MAEPLPTGMAHVIDYAFEPDKSDLLDIWLFANCSGCISTGTGLDQVSVIYGVPILFVNFIPLANTFSYAHSITVPKPLRWAKSGKPLTPSELLHNDFGYSSEYEDRGIEIVDMSAGELTLAVQEFWQRRIGSWNETAANEYRQNALYNEFVRWSGFDRIHGWRHPESRFGEAWLRSNWHESDDSTWKT